MIFFKKSTNHRTKYNNGMKLGSVAKKINRNTKMSKKPIVKS